MAVKCPKCHSENPDTARYCLDCGTHIGEKAPAKDRPRDFTETLQTPVRELTTGSTFAGRYQVIEELGKGGMGRVYKVFDSSIKEKIALKLLKPEIASDPETTERFSNELKLARKIRHKNVCGMFDLGTSEGTYFITMEYVSGEDLRSFIRRSKQLVAGTAVSIAKQICEGLAEAHRLGVVHRDLKPGNIMVDRDGNAKIMDFGIARSVSAKGITGPGVMIGTPEYMSPEQVDGREADLRSDLYSLGIILYEMVTGEAPFSGETPLSVAHKQKYEHPRDPKKLNPQLSDDLSRLIMKCLEKEREKRYSGAAEVLAELNRIDKGIPGAGKEAHAEKASTSKEITVKFNVRKIFLPAILVLAALAAAVYFFLVRKPAPALNPKLALVSIFVNQTGDAALDPLGKVAAYEIAQGLSQTGIVEVVPTVSVLETSRIINAESGVPKDQDEFRALAKGTGAGTLVSGAYYLIDKELQFHAAITDVAHGKNIRTLEPLKGSPDDKMGLVTELRRRVMGAMAMHFTGGLSLSEYARKIRQPPVYEAYQEFLQALDFWGVDYEQAARHLARAVELDPKFVAPKIWLAVSFSDRRRWEEADAHFRSILPFRDELSSYENRQLDWFDARLKGQLENCYRSAREAEKLAPNNFTNKYLLGSYAIRINRPREAVDVYAWMYSQDPKKIFTWPSTAWMIENLTYAHHMLGEYRKELKVARLGRQYFPKNLNFPGAEARALAARGKIREAGKIVDGCLDVDATRGTPGGVMMEAARELYAHGHKEASREFAARAIDWAESRPEAEKKAEAGRRFYADALFFAGRWDEAGRIFESLSSGYPENIDYQGSLGTLAARRGDGEKAMMVSDRLARIERPYLFGSPAYWRACIASLIGEKERAVALLKEAFSQGRSYGVSLHRDINLEPLWDYPPFKELLRPKG